jgi:hypothetical protein
MGTWGPGIMENDIASDVSARWRMLLAEGKTVSEAINQICLESEEMAHDPDDSMDMVFALAWLASSYGPVPLDLANRSKALIEQGHSLRRWAGSPQQEQRRGSEEDLLKRLIGMPGASPQARKIRRPRKLPYREGDWVMIPLDSGGFATGLIARMNGTGRLLGYFFGPRWQEPPVPDDVKPLRPQDAFWVKFCGDRGILEGNWQIFHHDDDWSRAEWPLPAFGYEDRLVNATYQRFYAEDTLDFVRQERVPRSVYENLPSDGSGSARTVEVFLDRRLPR